jgi:hypothetical protein
MHFFAFHRSRRAGLLAFAAFSAAAIMTAASNIAKADPTGGESSAASEAEAHEVRRCEWRPKEEHCYWIKVGAPSASRR